MRKKYFLTILLMILFIGNVCAENLSINVSNTVTAGNSYNVSVVYVGSTPLGSVDYKIYYNNSSCTMSYSIGTTNTILSGYYSSLYSTATFKSGTELLRLTCKNTSTTATYSISTSDITAYDATGRTTVSVSGASASVMEVTTTTTTTTETTTTTKEIPAVNAKTANEPTTKKTTTATSTVEAQTTNIVEESTTTETIIVTETEEVKETPLLGELKVVGYDINFDSNINTYTLQIGSDVKELYVIATPINENNQVENTGVVNIENLDEISIIVKSETGKTNNYTIKLNRDKVININKIYLGIIYILSIGIIGTLVVNIIKKMKLKKL